MRPAQSRLQEGLPRRMRTFCDQGLDEEAAPLPPLQHLLCMDSMICASATLVGVDSEGLGPLDQKLVTHDHAN